MSRRVSLPGAAELFRSTAEEVLEPAPTAEPVALRPSDDSPPGHRPDGARDPVGAPGNELRLPAEEPSAPQHVRRTVRDLETPVRGSGRVRHDEKITVYVSQDELLALEQARLSLRARHGVAVDRGRIVREAISALLADFAAQGDDSELVRRLSAR